MRMDNVNATKTSTGGTVTTTYTARYTDYAKSQGRTPEAQKAHDNKTASHRNLPFILWCSANPLPKVRV